MIKLLFMLLIGLGICWLSGCTKDDRDPCLQPRVTVLRAHAYRHADTGSAILDTLLPNPLFFPLTGGTTQYVYGGLKRISQFSFSLSNLADSSVWVVRPDSAFAVQDTLTFHYQTQLHFLSNSCGYTNFYNLTGINITRHALDSAIIARPDITTDANVLHLRLYY